MNAEVVSIEAAKAALMEASAACDEIIDCWTLSRRLNDANRAYNEALNAYIEAMWRQFPGVTVDLPRKPWTVSVVVETQSP